ncbi:hypothetical protein [Nocardiopsis sp. LOL_012]|uniref:hypothetical protein n=1 Tax=Nocardiopsis sp. LOL_012 TaxID=3345409 RepID=UPI003A84E495
MAGDTMLAALHGELAVHPRYTPGAARSDAYSLFLARSSAMAWLTEAASGTPGGLWGMNDAGQDAGTGAAHTMTRRLWFPVSLTTCGTVPATTG